MFFIYYLNSMEEWVKTEWSLNQREDSTQKKSNLCKLWMEIKNCIWCVLERPCSYQEMIKKNEEENNKKSSTVA